MQTQHFAEQTQPQGGQLACVELCLRFTGDIRYQNLESRFDVEWAAMTRDVVVSCHVRVFDRTFLEFRDSVISRIRRPALLKWQPVATHGMSDRGIQWARIVELEFAQHHDQPRTEITEMDYGIRAATVGYMLRKWSVACSHDRSLSGHEYRFWLKNHLAIYGVRNAVLAPGYRSPDQQRLEAETD